ncbi:MAG TPA: PAS domain S-box protein [Opitutaceae bacterium]|nr:PAS domain S-box protein [Opitutaceae bacterium]
MRSRKLAAYCAATGLPLLVLGALHFVAPGWAKSLGEEMLLVSVLVSAYLGGLGPGLLATLLSASAVFERWPGGGTNSSVWPHQSLVDWIAFSAFGLMISGLCGALHFAWRRAEASEQAFRQAEALAQMGTWSANMKNDTVNASRIFRTLVGAPAGRPLTSDDFFALVHPDDRARVRAAWEAARHGGPFDLEYRIVAGGQTNWLSVVTAFTCDWKGERVAAAGVTKNITAQKNAEAVLHARSELYRTLVTASPDAIVVANLEGAIVFASPRTQELFGFRAEELRGRNVLDFVAAGERGRARADFEKLLREEHVAGAEYALVPRSGEHFCGEISAALMHSTEGAANGIVLVTRDVTSRKRAEDTLRESEERFRQVVETIAEVFWMTDPGRQHVLYVSPSFEKIWGRSCAELCRDQSVWLESLHPEDRERVCRAGERAAAAAGRYDEIYRIVRPDGAVRWIRERAFPVIGPEGKVQRIVGSCEDITERKELERQFLHAQRLEAIGTLASGIAHDINNILAPMLMIPPLLKTRLLDHGDRDLLAMLETGAQRGANIARQLLMFSRGLEGERGPVQVAYLVKEMMNIMRETFPREITVVGRTSADLWPVTGDATQLHQVLMNLCVNARDAMPSGGRLVIETLNAPLGAEAAQLQPGAKPGPHIVIAVTDTGEGIAPETLDRIFDPFFTTKEIGKGTGLGLSTVLGIVKGHGGFVTVESRVGHGSVFKVFLPATPELNGARDPAGQLPEPSGRGELILVVDDEVAVREALRRLLERNGYRVITAGDGLEALERFLARRADVHVVLTDVMMPRMNGVALARDLRRLAPELRIIAATGLDEEGNREELARLGVVDLILKPCDAKQVLDVLERRDVLVG